MTIAIDAKHIVPYLPYNLKAEMLDYKIDYVGKQYDEIVGIHQWDKHCQYWSALTVGGSKPEINRIKPILRPLSDLIKKIDHNGKQVAFIDLFDDKSVKYGLGNIKLVALLKDMAKYNFITLHHLPYNVVEKLFEWHFDVFELIDSGLALNMNEI